MKLFWSLVLVSGIALAAAPGSTRVFAPPTGGSSYTDNQVNTASGWYSDGGSTGTPLRVETDAGVWFTNNSSASDFYIIKTGDNLSLKRRDGTQYMQWTYASGEVFTGTTGDYPITSLKTTMTQSSGNVAVQVATGAKVCLGTSAAACSSTIIGVGMSQTDQSADCDNAATGNAGSGKICIGAGQGSMVLTNSAINTNSIIQLTNVSDDTTCLSGYATVGAGSATIGCVGAGNATANTVMSFVVFNP